MEPVSAPSPLPCIRRGHSKKLKIWILLPRISVFPSLSFTTFSRSFVCLLLVSFQVFPRAVFDPILLRDVISALPSLPPCHQFSMSFLLMWGWVWGRSGRTIVKSAADSLTTHSFFPYQAKRSNSTLLYFFLQFCSALPSSARFT